MNNWTKQDWLNEDIKTLSKVLANISDQWEIANFLRDISTIKELNSLAERLKVAKLLDEWLSYRKINELTWVSTTTITRVAFWKAHGCGGYAKALEKI